VQSGDTLASLAEDYQTTESLLRQYNCLSSDSLLPGEVLYVPPLPTSTPIPCGNPYGWVLYTVKKGDNLFRIGLSYGITVTRLQQANCMGYSTHIYVGERLWVPNGPTLTPTKKSKN
jgi:LysM repeat protein